MISIVACCHGVKLCAHAARDFRSQENGAVTRMLRSYQVQPSHKECAIGVVCCKKEKCCVDCVIHHERDVHEEQQCICVAQARIVREIATHDLYCCLLPQYEALLWISDCNSISS